MNHGQSHASLCFHLSLGRASALRPAQSFRGRLFSAIDRQTDRHTDRQTAGWPWTCGCAESLCYGSAESASLSLQGAASALHSGWDGRGDQILYPQQQRAEVILRLRGSRSVCVWLGTTPSRGDNAALAFHSKAISKFFNYSHLSYAL